MIAHTPTAAACCCAVVLFDFVVLLFCCFVVLLLLWCCTVRPQATAGGCGSRTRPRTRRAGTTSRLPSPHAWPVAQQHNERQFVAIGKGLCHLVCTYCTVLPAGAELHRACRQANETGLDAADDLLNGCFQAPTAWERASAAETVAVMTDYMVEHGYDLVDWTGYPTTWGRWAPQSINHRRAFSDGRGLQSLQLLAFLAAAQNASGALPATADRAMRRRRWAASYVMMTGRAANRVKKLGSGQLSRFL